MSIGRIFYPGQKGSYLQKEHETPPETAGFFLPSMLGRPFFGTLPDRCSAAHGGARRLRRSHSMLPLGYPAMFSVARRVGRTCEIVLSAPACKARHSSSPTCLPRSEAK